MLIVLTLLAALLLVPAGAPAQTAAGAGVVNGIVRDHYGEGLPDAEVTLTNDSMGLRRVMETTIDGLFDAGGLPPAYGYRIKVTRKDYAGWESAEFQVPVGRPVTFEISLLPATASASGDKPTGRIVEAADSGIPLLLTHRDIEDLPAKSRRVDALAALAPALHPDADGSRLHFLGRQTHYPVLVDGVAADNSSSAHGSNLAMRVTQDSVQDMQVLPFGYPAYLGGSMGGVINIATRSGSNTLRGALYEYYRNEDWTAVRRDAPGKNLAGRAHQPGASLGGPLLEDRAFFFANLEARSARSQVMNRILNPLLADAAGTSVELANCRATAAQCAAAARFVESQMNVLSPASSRSLAGIFKLDLNVSESNFLRFAVRESRWRWPEGFATETVAPDGGLLGQNSLRARSRYYKFGWTGVLGSNGVNELSLATYRDRFVSAAPEPILSTGRLSLMLAGSNVGTAETFRTSTRETQRNQLGDHMRVTAGSHTLQFGVHWSENRYRIDELANAHGVYVYAGLTEFARDFGRAGTKSYSYLTQTLGIPVRYFRIREFSAYAQDTWRAWPGLTVTGGLRWDKAALPQPPASDPHFYQTKTIPSPNLAFSPRAGLAYELNDRTVARFGFGLFYAPYPASFIDALYLGNGVQQTSVRVYPNQTGSPYFPIVLATLANAPAGTKNILYANAKIRYSYTPQTTVALERRVGGGVQVSARYLASPGNRLLTAKDINLAEPALTRSYTILNSAGAAAGSFPTSIWNTRTSTAYSRVHEIANDGSSWYHAMVAEARKSFGHGLSAQASYVWSHAIANTTGPWLVPGVPLSSVNGEPDADRGNSSADQRHRAVLSWNWEPVLPSGAPAFARKLLNGWQQSGVVTLASGLPFTPLVVVSGQQFTGVSMVHPTSLNGSGGWARAPFLPVNSLLAESQYNVDARVVRKISVTERIQTKVLVEAFNLFNRQPAIAVQQIAYTASGGTLTPVRDLGRGVKSAAPRTAQIAFRIEF